MVFAEAAEITCAELLGSNPPPLERRHWRGLADGRSSANCRARSAPICALSFGTYAKVCKLADELLLRAGDPTAIDEACKGSPIGKLLPDDLYVHRSALDYLEPLLRIYEGCGRAYLGEVEGANLIKIHRRSGKLSYLIHPDFDTDPHPALERCVRLCLRTRTLDCYDYGAMKKGTVPLGERDSPPFSEPTHPPPQRNLPAPHAPPVRQIRPPHPARGKRRPAPGEGDRALKFRITVPLFDWHAHGLAGTSASARPEVPRPSARKGAVAAMTTNRTVGENGRIAPILLRSRKCGRFLSGSE